MKKKKNTKYKLWNWKNYRHVPEKEKTQKFNSVSIVRDDCNMESNVLDHDGWCFCSCCFVKILLTEVSIERNNQDLCVCVCVCELFEL